MVCSVLTHVFGRIQSSSFLILDFSLWGGTLSTSWCGDRKQQAWTPNKHRHSWAHWVPSPVVWNAIFFFFFFWAGVWHNWSHLLERSLRASVVSENVSSKLRLEPGHFQTCFIWPERERKREKKTDKTKIWECWPWIKWQKIAWQPSNLQQALFSNRAFCCLLWVVSSESWLLVCCTSPPSITT